jgi:methylmalonyl-CoA mutase C-terminal domain/subunit
MKSCFVFGARIKIYESEAVLLQSTAAANPCAQFYLSLNKLMPETNIRVLLAKPGLDGHDRGVKVIARALRDAGMEVIYTGLRQTPEQIVNAALQEDVNIVGLSILSGAHMTIFPRVLELMKEKGMDDVLLFGGGIIPDDDIPKLKAAGVGEIFLPGASTEDIIKYIRENVTPRD